MTTILGKKDVITTVITDARVFDGKNDGFTQQVSVLIARWFTND